MKLYLFQGKSDSSDFESRVGFLSEFEADTWADLMVCLVEYRITELGLEDDEDDGPGGWLEIPFVKMLFRIGGGSFTKTEENLLVIAKNIRDGKYTASASLNESLAKELIYNMENENTIDPFLIIKKSSKTKSTLRYLGAL